MKSIERRECRDNGKRENNDIEKLRDSKSAQKKENEDNETSAHNPRTCSEAVGMEKLIPSLRQRQQIGNPINIHHVKSRII